MYDAPAHVIDPGEYAKEIHVRSRSEFFRWVRNTPAGELYLRDCKLQKKMNFLGMRRRQGWAKRLAALYHATAIAKDVKGPFKSARREAYWRMKQTPHEIDSNKGGRGRGRVRFHRRVT